MIFWSLEDNSEFAGRGLWPYLGVALLAGAKFVAGIVAALAQQFTLVEMLLTVSLGGCVGVWVYTYLGQALYQLRARWLGPYWPKRQHHLFGTSRHAFIQRVWRRYGLVGVAALIPLLSPQISIGLALSLGEKPPRILLYMALSVIVWTLLSSELRDAALALMGAVANPSPP